jgi:hypothetical protein
LLNEASFCSLMMLLCAQLVLLCFAIDLAPLEKVYLHENLGELI